MRIQILILGFKGLTRGTKYLLFVVVVKTKVGSTPAEKKTERSPWIILIPRAHDPSGLRQESKALAGSKPGSP